MRLATILLAGEPRAALVREDRVLPLALPGGGLAHLRGIAAGGAAGLARVHTWAEGRPPGSWLPLTDVALLPAVSDPGAIYAIGMNYHDPARPNDPGSERPLVYGKVPTSVTGHGSVISWDRSLTANVDAEVELGVVIGLPALAVPVGDAEAHVFGYTCINDVSSRDPWLDGDQWLLGKSLPGFCPVGPWVVTPDEVAPDGLRLGCKINGVAIQDDSTARMRFSIGELIAYISRHVELRPGDLIATGTPARLAGPPGPERHLQAGDEVTVWIEHIGELRTTIA